MEFVEPYISALQEERGEFNVDNAIRNKLILAKCKETGVKVPRAYKTGTTICGVTTAEGVVLGADTRATFGDVIWDKHCLKLHHLADNVWCGGAGTSADLAHVTQMFESKFKLQSLATGRQIRFASVLQQLSQLFYKYRGHVSCAIVVGGVDCTGAHLAAMSPEGNCDLLPFAAMGSGSLHAISILENGFRDGLTLEEGKELVADAIHAGVSNDLYSGTSVDVMTIDLRGVPTVFRGYRNPNPRTFRMPKPISFPPGSTAVF